MRLSNAESVTNPLQGSTAAPVTASAANGLAAESDGWNYQLVEIVENNVGTATVTLEGSLDGSVWYAVGYQEIDATASPARSVTAISVVQNSKHVYQVLDLYPKLRARVSSNTGSLVVRGYFTVSG